MVMAAVLWSAGGLGVKLVHASSLSIAGYRSLFAIPVMLVDTVLRARRAAVDPRECLRSPRVWGGAVSYALMVVTFVVAAKLTTAANAILIQYTGPIYVALLSWPVLKERLRAWDWFAIVGCVVGMAIFFWTEIDPRGKMGNLVAVLSSFGFGGLPILLRLEERVLVARGRSALAGVAPITAMTLGNGLAVLVGAREMVAHPPDSWVGFLVVALLGTFQIGVPYILYGIAVRRLRAVESSLIATVEPVISPLWVFLVVGEHPTLSAGIGGAFIVGSVLLQTVGTRSKT
jgi:drug/metabolite transporter (DMT)-like permease